MSYLRRVEIKESAGTIRIPQETQDSHASEGPKERSGESLGRSSEGTSEIQGGGQRPLTFPSVEICLNPLARMAMRLRTLDFVLGDPWGSLGDTRPSLGMTGGPWGTP